MHALLYIATYSNYAKSYIVQSSYDGYMPQTPVVSSIVQGLDDDEAILVSSPEDIFLVVIPVKPHNN